MTTSYSYQPPAITILSSLVAMTDGEVIQDVAAAALDFSSQGSKVFAANIS